MRTFPELGTLVASIVDEPEKGEKQNTKNTEVYYEIFGKEKL